MSAVPPKSSIQDEETDSTTSTYDTTDLNVEPPKQNAEGSGNDKTSTDITTKPPSTSNSTSTTTGSSDLGDDTTSDDTSTTASSLPNGIIPPGKSGFDTRFTKVIPRNASANIRTTFTTVGQIIATTILSISKSDPDNAISAAIGAISRVRSTTEHHYRNSGDKIDLGEVNQEYRPYVSPNDDTLSEDALKYIFNHYNPDTPYDPAWFDDNQIFDMGDIIMKYLNAADKLNTTGKLKGKSGKTRLLAFQYWATVCLVRRLFRFITLDGTGSYTYTRYGASILQSVRDLYQYHGEYSEYDRYLHKVNDIEWGMSGEGMLLENDEQLPEEEIPDDMCRHMQDEDVWLRIRDVIDGREIESYNAINAVRRIVNLSFPKYREAYTLGQDAFVAMQVSAAPLLYNGSILFLFSALLQSHANP